MPFCARFCVVPQGKFMNILSLIKRFFVLLFICTICVFGGVSAAIAACTTLGRRKWWCLGNDTMRIWRNDIYACYRTDKTRTYFCWVGYILTTKFARSVIKKTAIIGGFFICIKTLVFILATSYTT